MLHTLPQIKTKGAKRRGRGVGSGKGFHTTGRGQKGQGARRHIGIMFEGVKTKKSLLHRIPMLRGKLKFKSLGKPLTITLNDLDKHPEGVVTVSSLVKNKIVRKSHARHGIKVVATGKVTHKYEVHVHMSKLAQTAVVDAGGSMV